MNLGGSSSTSRILTFTSASCFAFKPDICIIRSNHYKTWYMYFRSNHYKMLFHNLVLQRKYSRQRKRERCGISRKNAIILWKNVKLQKKTKIVMVGGKSYVVRRGGGVIIVWPWPSPLRSCAPIWSRYVSSPSLSKYWVWDKLT